MSTASAFLCGMILLNPRPFHPTSALLPLFQSLVPSQRHPSDPDGQPKLSPDQQMNSCIWKRPNQRPSQSVDILRRRILPEDILQHIVTDCSVCASISVCLEHSRRFGSTVSEHFWFDYHALIFSTACRIISIDFRSGWSI